MLRCRALALRLRAAHAAQYSVAASVTTSARQLLSEGRPYEAAQHILQMKPAADRAATGSATYLQAQLLQHLGSKPEQKDLDLAFEVFDKVLKLSNGVDKFSCARLSLMCINTGLPNRALEPWARLLEVLGSKVPRTVLDKILERPEFEPAALAALAAYFIAAGPAADPATAHKLVPRKTLPTNLASLKGLGGIASREDRDTVLQGLARLQKYVTKDFTSPEYLERVANASFAEVGNLWTQLQMACEPQDVPEATYVAFIRRLAETRQTDKAFATWQIMVDSGIPITTLGWSALLKAALHAPENSREIFTNLWDRMLASGYEPDAQCWQQRLLALTKRGGNTDAAFKEFAELQNTPERLDIKCVNVVLAAYGRKQDFAKADAIKKWATEHGMKPTAHTYNALIQSSIGKPEVSSRYLAEMEEEGVSPDVVTYTFVAEQMLRRGQSIAELLTEMNSKGIEANEQFNAVVAYGIGHNTKNIDVARHTMATMLQRKLPVSLQTLGAFIELELRYGDVDRAAHYVSLIDKFGLPPNIPTYNQLIRGALSRNRLDVAAAAFKKLASGAYRRLTPNTYTYEFILKPWSTADLELRSDVQSLVRTALLSLAEHPQAMDYRLAQLILKVAAHSGAGLVPAELVKLAEERSVELFDKRKTSKR